MRQPPFFSAPIAIGAFVGVLAIIPRAAGVVMPYTNSADWQAASSGYQVDTITFTGFQSTTIITNQYESLGVLFTDGDDRAYQGFSSFPNDTWGLRGGGGTGEESVTLQFLAPRNAIAVDFPGSVRFELYQANTLIYTSGDFGGVGFGFFAGLISTESFDRVRLRNFASGVVFIDDLHFGVPAPGSLALLGLAALYPRRRRRA